MTRLLMQALIDALDKNDHYEQAKVLTEIRVALAQPEKEWVGLTAYEVQELHIKNPHFGNFACAIEAKLKEKNS